MDEIIYDDLVLENFDRVWKYLQNPIDIIKFEIEKILKNLVEKVINE